VPEIALSYAKKSLVNLYPEEAFLVTSNYEKIIKGNLSKLFFSTTFPSTQISWGRKER